MDHLHPDVRHCLSMPPEQRMFLMRSERWIGYAEADRVRAELELLYQRPRTSRMPGVLLVGDSNQGKSSILRKFCSTHPTVDDPAANRAVVPVLVVECPPGPDERRFYHIALSTLNAPFRFSSRIEEKHLMLKTILKEVGTRVLILDEIHNLVTGGPMKQRYFMQMIKYISNDLHLPIVLVGIAEAKNVFTTDDQLARRFRTVVLPKWKDKKKFTMLLNSFEALLPLKKRSQLNAESVVNEVLALSEGILGEVAYLLVEAACAAIKSGTEQITLKGIRAVNFIPPSQRHASLNNGQDGDADQAQAE